MQTAQSGVRSALRSKPSLLDISLQWRLMIYELLFSPLARRHRNVEYHFYDKTYEVTANVRKFRDRSTKKGRTAILRTCKRFHDEALPLLCQHANFIASLRPAFNPLDLSSHAGKLLAHAKKLELNISIAFPCQFAPTIEETEPPSTVSTKRRGSWNGGPSDGPNSSTTEAPKPFTRARRKSLASPAPTKMPHEMCFTTYLRRLESLLGAVNYGKSLRLLHIQIDNLDRSLNAQNMETILSHMEARLRVPETCRVVVHLERDAYYLVSHIRMVRFLDEIQL